MLSNAFLRILNAFHTLSYAYIQIHTLTYAFPRFHTLSYAFVRYPTLPCASLRFYIMLYNAFRPKVSEQEQDRRSRVYRLYLRKPVKSEVREIIIGHVELTLIFLFDDFLCKITILEPLKVRFLGI